MRHSPLAVAPRTLFFCLALFLSGTAARSQEAVPPPPSLPPPALEEISPGIFRIGALTLNKEARSVTFPGKLNMDKGSLEYLLTGTMGSTHESLLVTEVAPNDVHMAMLLLGAKGAGLHAPAPEEQAPGQITDEYLKTAPQPVGDQVSITVTWTKDGKQVTTPAEDWLRNTETDKPAERGPWIYTGSMFANDKFLAQVEQAFVALVIYPSALINNPRKGNHNDNDWAVNEKAVPPVDTPLQITIRLLPTKTPTP